ncbi:unnamed protein product, partial [Mesorhabditis spiculigera]
MVVVELDYAFFHWVPWAKNYLTMFVQTVLSGDPMYIAGAFVGIAITLIAVLSGGDYVLDIFFPHEPLETHETKPVPRQQPAVATSTTPKPLLTITATTPTFAAPPQPSPQPTRAQTSAPHPPTPQPAKAPTGPPPPTPKPSTAQLSAPPRPTPQPARAPTSPPPRVEAKPLTTAWHINLWQTPHENGTTTLQVVVFLDKALAPNDECIDMLIDKTTQYYTNALKSQGLAVPKMKGYRMYDRDAKKLKVDLGTVESTTIPIVGFVRATVPDRLVQVSMVLLRDVLANPNKYDDGQPPETVVKRGGKGYERWLHGSTCLTFDIDLSGTRINVATTKAALNELADDWCKTLARRGIEVIDLQVHSVYKYSVLNALKRWSRPGKKMAGGRVLLVVPSEDANKAQNVVQASMNAAFGRWGGEMSMTIDTEQKSVPDLKTCDCGGHKDDDLDDAEKELASVFGVCANLNEKMLNGVPGYWERTLNICLRDWKKAVKGKLVTPHALESRVRNCAKQVINDSVKEMNERLFDRPTTTPRMLASLEDRWLRTLVAMKAGQYGTPVCYWVTSGMSPLFALASEERKPVLDPKKVTLAMATEKVRQITDRVADEALRVLKQATMLKIEALEKKCVDVLKVNVAFPKIPGHPTFNGTYGEWLYLTVSVSFDKTGMTDGDVTAIFKILKGKWKTGLEDRGNNEGVESIVIHKFRDGTPAMDKKLRGLLVFKVPPELPEVGSQHTYKRIVDVRCDASHVVLVPSWRPIPKKPSLKRVSVDEAPDFYRQVENGQLTNEWLKKDMPSLWKSESAPTQDPAAGWGGPWF